MLAFEAAVMMAIETPILMLLLLWLLEHFACILSRPPSCSLAGAAAAVAAAVADAAAVAAAVVAAAGWETLGL
ncbi:MAG: hypothetical protein VXZ27_13125 [SAR324 cluster bacterium]|nr:hypothetical protein [SAR324 cluster bacterium]